MITLPIITLTLLILLIAALTKATLGFGESLLAIPLLTLVVGIQTATPLVSLVAAGVTLLMLLRSWRQIDLSATWRLTLAALIGIPLGVWGLKQLPQAWTTAALGVLLIVVGLYYLLRPTLRALPGAGWTYVFGFLAGVCGGAYNMAGPPMIVYGTVRRWSPEQFRVTLQSFFFPVNILILISHASAGLWTREVLTLFALSLPVMLAGFGLGNHFSQRLDTRSFERLLYVALIVLGAVLLI